MTIRRNPFHASPFHAGRAAALALLLVLPARAHAQSAPDSQAAQAPAGTGSAPAVSASDPWTRAQLIEPAALAAALKGPAAARPMLLHVGFKTLFGEGAIPGSHYAGPTSKPEGIASLKKAVKGVPHDRAIVLYCGCCPWDHCPNVRPAFKTMHSLGFKNVKALYIHKNLDTDWVAAGYPIDQPKH